MVSVRIRGRALRQKDALRLEQLVVGIAADAVRAGVLDLDLADLPDGCIGRLDHPGDERVCRGVGSAGAADAEVSRGNAVERDREGDVLDCRRRVPLGAVVLVGYADPIDARRAGEARQFREIGAGKAVGGARGTREAGWLSGSAGAIAARGVWTGGGVRVVV